MKMVQHIKKVGRFLWDILDVTRIQCAKGTSLLCMSLAFLLASCVNEPMETTEVPNTPVQVSDFYISLNIQVPTGGDGTRSTTDNGKEGDSSDGVLAAADNENVIETAQLYFFDAETKIQLCKFFAYKNYTLTRTRAGENNEWSIIAKVEPRELRELMGKTIHLYVFANPYNYYYQPGSDKNETSFQGSSFDISSLNQRPVQPFGDGPEGQLCPMANKEMFTITAFNGMDPEGMTDQQILQAVSGLFEEQTDSEGNKSMLWEVKDEKQNTRLILERQIARIDYKDGSTITNKPFLYTLSGAKYYTEDGIGHDVYLKIMSMQLFNIDKEAYTLRHTQRLSPDGGEDGALTVFGREKDIDRGENYNWMADYNWGKKKNNIISVLNSWSSLTNSNTDALISHEDLGNWEKNNNTELTRGYVPWHYVMENTLPSNEKMTKMMATGVRFNVALCDNNGNPVTGSEGSFKRIIMSDGKYQDIDYRPAVTKEITKVVDEESTTESKIMSQAGYYLQYDYLIRHNNAGEDAPMKIGIVRNNVYQLSVTKFENLPDPKVPEDLGIEIKIQVLPWGLRVDDDIILK